MTEVGRDSEEVTTTAQVIESRADEFTLLAAQVRATAKLASGMDAAFKGAHDPRPAFDDVTAAAQADAEALAAALEAIAQRLRGYGSWLKHGVETADEVERGNAEVVAGIDTSEVGVPRGGSSVPDYGDIEMPATMPLAPSVGTVSI